MDEEKTNRGVNDNRTIPGFAPTDPTDGRKLLEWRSKWESEAWRCIWIEAAYLGLLLFIIPILLVILWLEYPKSWWGLSDRQYHPILKYGIAWVSGLLGGTLFDLKWLVHTVARQIWHTDRRLWRLFTPHVSGALALAVIALISSGLFRIFNPQAVESLSLVLGLAFLVGYFSDSAIAKLREIAETVFGASQAIEKHATDKSRKG